MIRILRILALGALIWSNAANAQTANSTVHPNTGFGGGTANMALPITIAPGGLDAKITIRNTPYSVSLGDLVLWSEFAVQRSDYNISNGVAGLNSLSQVTASVVGDVSEAQMGSTGKTTKDYIDGQFQTPSFTGSRELTTPQLGDATTSVANTRFVANAVQALAQQMNSSSSSAGFQTVPVTYFNVCQTGCVYGDIQSAYTAALAQAHKLTGAQTVQISIADGTYNISNSLVVSDPAAHYINIVGNTSSPGNVVLNYQNTRGKNLSGILATQGGELGLVDGVTITQPTDGTGALASTDSNGRHIWNNQSYGAGIGAYGAGSSIRLGPHVVVTNFYYGVIADNNGGIDAPDGGVIVRRSGDVNYMARGGGVIVCTPCTASDASDFTNSGNPLGSNYDAERNGTLYIDGSIGSQSLVNGVVGITGGAIWAHNMTLTGPLITSSGQGIQLWTGSKGEFTGTTVSGSYNIGVSSSDMSVASCDLCKISYNTVGIAADGGRVIGGGLTITGNSSYGVQALHQGSVILFNTFANMKSNGQNFSTEPAGVNAVSGSTYAASSIFVQ